jgi:hypothetical protein
VGPIFQHLHDVFTSFLGAYMVGGTLSGAALEL